MSENVLGQIGLSRMLGMLGAAGEHNVDARYRSDCDVEPAACHTAWWEIGLRNASASLQRFPDASGTSGR